MARPPSVALVVVAAVADNGVIGRDNALPWRLSSDLKRFKALTMGKPLLMGRKTFLSIGKSLPGRTNIVVSRKADFAAPAVTVAPTLEFALQAARGDALRRGVNEIMVIGGTDIYKQLMSRADRLEITHVHTQPAGDAQFPKIAENEWRTVMRQEHPAGPQDEADFAFATYLRA